jgi:hypothetical protein
MIIAKRFLLLGAILVTRAAAEIYSCVSFIVGPGTGCDWMCNYCANALGTNNYYFTTPVCTYQAGGCVGNPVAGAEYACCAV